MNPVIDRAPPPTGVLDTAVAPAEREAMVAVLQQARQIVLASAVGGNPSATALPCAADGDGVLFVCARASRAAAQLALNPAVQALVFDAAGGRAVELSGYGLEIVDEGSRDCVARTFAQRLPAQVCEDLRAAGRGRFALFRLQPTRSALLDGPGETSRAWVDFPRNVPRSSRLALGALGSALRLWVRAARAPFFTAAVVPMLLGAAVARREMTAAGWNWAMFAWVLLGAVLAAAGTNLINDYGDSRSGADDCNAAAGNPFTGGSRMIQLGLLAPWQVLLASVACFGATVAIGLHLNAALSGSAFGASPLLGIGALGCLLGVAYTVGPFALSYRGLGEIAVALGFGPVIVLGSSYVLSAAAAVAWPWREALLASVPVALFIVLVLWINQFQDAPSDAASGKRNWVVRMSEQAGGGFDFGRAFAVYSALNLAAFAIIAGLGVLGWRDASLATPWVWIALLALPLYLRERAQGLAWVARWRDRPADRPGLPFELLPVNATTIAVHLAGGLLMALGYLLAAGV